MKLLAKITAVFDRFLDLLAIVAASLIIFTMLAVIYEVVMRYFLDRPTIWVGEITEISLLYVCFLGTAWLLKEEGHVKMDIVVSQLKPRTQALFGIISSIIGIIVSSAFVWYGVKVTWDDFQGGIYTPTALEVPTVLILAVIPVGSFLLFIQFLRRTNGYLRGWRTSPGKEQRL